jgi:dTDP-4-amino-4,6-dideoxygalactose transaminase
VHLQPAYVRRVAKATGGCPETEAAAGQILSLPLYPELTEDQVTSVCAAVRDL